MRGGARVDPAWRAGPAAASSGSRVRSLENAPRGRGDGLWRVPQADGILLMARASSVWLPPQSRMRPFTGRFAPRGPFSCHSTTSLPGSAGWSSAPHGSLSGAGITSILDLRVACWWQPGWWSRLWRWPGWWSARRRRSPSKWRPGTPPCTPLRTSPAGRPTSARCSRRSIRMSSRCRNSRPRPGAIRSSQTSSTWCSQGSGRPRATSPLARAPSSTRRRRSRSLGESRSPRPAPGTFWACGLGWWATHRSWRSSGSTRSTSRRERRRPIPPPGGLNARTCGTT
jgi:hypothetical protein